MRVKRAQVSRHDPSAGSAARLTPREPILGRGCLLGKPGAIHLNSSRLSSIHASLIFPTHPVTTGRSEDLRRYDRPGKISLGTDTTSPSAPCRRQLRAVRQFLALMGRGNLSTGTYPGTGLLVCWTGLLAAGVRGNLSWDGSAGCWVCCCNSPNMYRQDVLNGSIERAKGVNTSPKIRAYDPFLFPVQMQGKSVQKYTRIGFSDPGPTVKHKAIRWIWTHHGKNQSRIAEPVPRCLNGP